MIINSTQFNALRFAFDDVTLKEKKQMLKDMFKFPSLALETSEYLILKHELEQTKLQPKEGTLDAILRYASEKLKV